MKTVNQRVKETREAKGLTQTFVAKKVGLTQPTLSAFENGTGSTTVLPQIANTLGVSVDFLLSGKEQQGDKSSRNSDSSTPQTNKYENNVTQVKSKLLPVLSWVQAGNFTGMDSIELENVVDWYPALSDDDCDECFYLRVVGISNAPRYVDGDLILIDPFIDQANLVSGNLIVVRNLDNTATFKKLIIESNGERYLQALNPDWKPNIIALEEGSTFVGAVIDAIRPLGVPKPIRKRNI
jgi:SOS-response transcriptional repressor LexA